MKVEYPLPRSAGQWDQTVKASPVFRLTLGEHTIHTLFTSIVDFNSRQSAYKERKNGNRNASWFDWSGGTFPALNLRYISHSRTYLTKFVITLGWLYLEHFACRAIFNSVICASDLPAWASQSRKYSKSHPRKRLLEMGVAHPTTNNDVYFRTRNHSRSRREPR